MPRKGLPEPRNGVVYVLAQVNIGRMLRQWEANEHAGLAVPRRCAAGSVWGPCLTGAAGTPVARGRQMDENQARERLLSERAEVLEMLRESEAEAEAERAAAAANGELEDPVSAVSAEGMAIASANRFRDRVAAIDRALQRLDHGTYGRSVRSGEPIPSDRLDADPAAELTIEEARAAERR